MPSEEEYRERVREYDHAVLLEVWQAILAGDTPGWEAGKAFEYIILRAFELEGAEVSWPYRVHLDGEEIEQIDGVIYADGLACLVEAKDYRTAVKVEVIAKLRNQLLRRPSLAIVAVFARAGFSESASTLARFFAPQTILLWHGDEFDYGLRERVLKKGLIAKFRHAVEYGFPDYKIQYME